MTNKTFLIKQTMKNKLVKNVALGLLTIWGANTTFAQEKFYMKNGNAFTERLTEATDGKVSYYQTNGDRKILRTFGRDNIEVAFNAKGNYLMMSDIKRSVEDSRKQLKQFYNSEGPKSDIIISAVPLKVIVCQSPPYDGADAVNYKTEKGESASMPKSNIVAIIKADGQHEIYKDLNEAVPFLKSAWADFQNKKSKAAPVETPEEIAARLLAEKIEKERLLAIAEAERIKNGKVDMSGKMTDAELEIYKAKAIVKVEEFANYLKIITDRDRSSTEQDNAIDQAVKLFMADAMIEVSSVTKSKTSKYPVREYLTRLKLLPYGKIDIAWTQIQYVSQPILKNDGNYYGTITGVQTFTGYGNGNNKDQMQYSDVTKKSVETKFETYDKIEDSIKVRTWGILLGSIGVAN